LGLAFYPWYVRSTSKATDGLYVFDALKRLYDIETLKAFSGDTGKAALPRDPSEPKHYCTLGALGKAFEKRERPAVVLIDEIDKADLDFPNDLLTVLDDPWSFKIEETGETIKADESCLPLVIITSNKEKGNLPAPFLRRCIYQILSFPDNPADLQMIVDSHYADKAIEIPSELSRAAVKRFLGIRSQQGLFKRPGTSEFLDWLEALRTFETNGKLADVDAEAIPYPELLFKQRSDFQLQTRA
jgi:MoxR-like ATPase